MPRSRAFAPLLLLALSAASAHASDEALRRVAREARQTIAVVQWFYVRNRACPQPARPRDLVELQTGLGDGFSVEPQGSFVAIRGIAMSGEWHYYASPRYPGKCTLWRRLDGDAALLWHNGNGVGSWGFIPGDGGPERRVSLYP